MSAFFFADVSYDDFNKLPKNQKPSENKNFGEGINSDCFPKSPKKNFVKDFFYDDPDVFYRRRRQKRTETKTAVHLALSNNGPGDSLWIYDNNIFTYLLRKWNDINSNPLHKAIKLVDSYLGIDNSPYCLVIGELKKQYERGEIETIYDLLEKLIAIKRENPRGLLQTIIAVIASKAYPELLIDSDQNLKEEELIFSFSL